MKLSLEPILRWFSLVFRRRVEAPMVFDRLAPISVEPVPESRQAPKEAAPSVLSAETEITPFVEEDTDVHFGAFYEFDGLMDALPQYFRWLKLLKRDDRNAFDLYSRVGGQIVSHAPGSKLYPRLTDVFKITRPAFGLVHYLTPEDDKKSIYPVLSYFQKMERPFYVQPSAGTVYAFSSYLVDPENIRTGRFAWCCHLSVDADNNVRVLKELTPVRGEIRTAQQWSYPSMHLHWFSEHRDRFDDIHGFIGFLFAETVNAALYSQDGVRINVCSDGLAGVFNVPMNKTVEFFKDRQRSITKSGRTKPIFHATKAHVRQLRSGKTSSVKMHFRGERDFSWKGYDILITVPGIHHKSVLDFTGGAVFQDDEEKVIPKDMIDMARLGAIFSRHIHHQRRGPNIGGGYRRGNLGPRSQPK